MKTVKNDLIKLIAVAAAGVIAGTGVTAAAINAANNKKDTASTSTSVSSESDKTDTKTAKDETVYVLANADGSVKKIIVSDWIKNGLNEKSLKDKTELEDVKNVKGDESYVMDTDNMRVWNADGADIYYQGTISKELPVDLKVSYKLDGKTVSADEIAGKSGKATIRFDYTNKQYSEVNIGGKTEKIYVPFAMLTGLMLDNDVFTNVSVTNGKIINDGDRTIVAGFALPGLQENLNLSKDKFEIPDYIEVTADVKNFALTTTLTLATNSLFNEFDTSKLNSADDLQAQLNELTSGMTKLINGSSELYGGLTTLLSKSKELVAGIDKLSAGTDELSSGAAALNAGLNTLVSNNGDLTSGAKQVFDTLLATVTKQLNEGGIEGFEALTVDNYKTVLNGLTKDPMKYLSAAKKAEVLKTAETAVNAQLKNAGVPEAYYTPVKVMLFDRLSNGKTREAAMKEINDLLTPAVTVETISKTVEADETVYNKLKASEGEETAALIAKVCNALSQQSGGKATPVKILRSGKATELITAAQAGQAALQAAATDKNAATKLTALYTSLATPTVTATVKTSIETAVTSLDSYNTFYQGVLAYTAGVKEAADGSAKVNAGAKQLKDGAAELKAGASQLVPGEEKLADGSKQLADGIKQLNDKGISKLTGLAGDDLQNLVDRVKATVDVSKNYKSFAGIADGTDGSVKFIYKTDEVKSK